MDQKNGRTGKLAVLGCVAAGLVLLAVPQAARNARHADRGAEAPRMVVQVKTEHRPAPVPAYRGLAVGSGTRDRLCVYDTQLPPKHCEN